MLRVSPLQIPSVLPHSEAIRSWGNNRHSYKPEFWEFQYEVYRYLSSVPAADLSSRYRAIIRNMCTLISRERHVIPIQSPLSSWYWYRKEHQTGLELSMRGMEPPVQPPAGVLDHNPQDAPLHPRSPNAGDVLFRYGKRQYMQAMVERGSIRISPTSFYQTLELDGVRANDERAKHCFWPREHTPVSTQDGRGIRLLSDVRRTVSGPDYYLLCLSCDWDPALFGEFDADACVIIRNPEVFAERLAHAAQPQLSGWYFHHNPAEYFDPYEMDRHQYFDAAICKDLRFAYQREYRFLWIHMDGQEASEFRFLELGSLKNIAELHLR
jgi:hypothetical protein